MTPRSKRAERPVRDEVGEGGEAGVIVAHRGVAVEVELASGARRMVRVRRRSPHPIHGNFFRDSSPRKNPAATRSSSQSISTR